MAVVTFVVKLNLVHYFHVMIRPSLTSSQPCKRTQCLNVETTTESTRDVVVTLSYPARPRSTPPPPAQHLHMFSLARATTPLNRIASRALTDLSAHGNVLGGQNITPAALKTFEVWHTGVTKVMKGEPTGGLKDMMKDHVADKVKFYPPTYFNHWEGKDEFIILIGCVSEVFGKSFVYDRQFVSDDGKDWCLEFEADIEGDPKSRVQGVDLVRLDDEGKIVEFKVYCRPPNGVGALKDAMMKRVPIPMAAMKAKKALGF